MFTFATAWLFLLDCILLQSNCYKCDDIHGKVVFSNVVFRHGIRAPTEIYPNDPLIEHTATMWPDGLGELTVEGAVQQYHLGKWLRKRYQHLLPQDGKYSRSAINVLSSDIDRSIMSAAANMAGMFPNEFDGNLGGLAWPIVPVHTIPLQYDNIIRFSRPCPKYKSEMDRFKTTEEYLKMVRPYEQLFRFSGYMSGLNITVQNPWQFGTLYVTLLIEEMYGLELPQWCYEIFPDKMSVAVGVIFSIITSTPTLSRLRVGFLLNRLLTSMEDKVRTSEDTLEHPPQNLTVYSGHDTTLVPLLHAMGVYNFILPPFSSAVLIELRQKPNCEPVVTVFYKNSTSLQQPPFLLKLPGCAEACPLSELRELWSPLLIENESKWEDECRD